MFVGNALAYLSGAPLWGGSRPYPQTLRLGWKGLPGTKALAYYIKLKLRL